MNQDIVNTVYDKLDEVRDAFEAYISKVDPTDRSLNDIANRLEFLVRTIKEKYEP